ncbi:MAG: hypothetical protein A3I01_13120 [Betaproteobacteria bacterium RIFCSPLOWO2_02_FULL_65_24]|nr:MAG: hypothetical protein A3I01_13120 [Betaproteobacteria bacterium RIFCSPLOWO2_02_FULL_65_24]
MMHDADAGQPLGTQYRLDAMPHPVLTVALRFAPGSERGVSWLRLATTANIVQRIDYEAR